MNQNNPFPDNAPLADPPFSISQSVLQCISQHGFLQDIATFHLCGAFAGETSVSFHNAPNVLDGVTRQKVLSVACPQSGVVIIGLHARRLRLNPDTGELTVSSDSADESAPAPPFSPAQDGLLDAGADAHVPDPSLTVPVAWAVGTQATEQDGRKANALFAYTDGGRLFLTGQDGVPLRDVCCVAQDTDGTLWIGGADGAARLREGVWRYFAGRRWLPDNRVNAIALDDQSRAWIGTDAGLACIAPLRITWDDKARYYEALTQARHNRGGFVTECLLPPLDTVNRSDNDGGPPPLALASVSPTADFSSRAMSSADSRAFLHEASDNDGLWTSLYVCAECFRWSVTGEHAARDLARQSLYAMLRLLQATGIAGFPARAIAGGDERVALSEPAANWTVSPRDANILVKGDTSSDEIAGHYLAWFVYHRHAADETAKNLIADACRAVTDHILDHDYTLTGPDGKRTSWGVWTPETLNHDPEWAGERGLGSLLMLSHLRVALHLCPCARYEQAYHSLVTRHRFALNTIRQKVLPPEGEDNHSDDELAACAYYPLLMLESDARLRALYLRSLERTNAILRPARSPFHNVIYQACTGRLCDVDAVHSWLKEAPLDLRDWAMTNSHRPDIRLRPKPDRFGKPQTAQPLPPSEIGVMKWNRNPFLADWQGDGTREMDGAFWLLPYWMARYHHIL